MKRAVLTYARTKPMHLHLNHTEEHWVLDGENASVGLILCAQNDEAVAPYALDVLPNKVMLARLRLRPTSSGAGPLGSLAGE